jgi:hypothetical protein
MKCKLKPFGFPAYINCKRRIAKKYIGKNKWKRFEEFHNYIGLVNDCSDLNMNPVKIEPEYFSTGRKGYVLWDLSISDNTNSCSFIHCGIEMPKSYEECKKYIEDTIEKYKDNDVWKFAERYRKIQLHKDGTYEYMESEK